MTHNDYAPSRRDGVSPYVVTYQLDGEPAVTRLTWAHSINEARRAWPWSIAHPASNGEVLAGRGSS